MKLFVFSALFCCILSNASGQVSGNANYQNQVRYPDNNIEVVIPTNANLSISVSGLANLTADSYVAIFSVSQVAKTTEEVNTLIDGRINQALSGLKTRAGVQTFVDMISFVPVFEYEVEKKIFSKKTYNEIPKGFELKKNIHVRYKDPNLLNEIISLLSNAEIYDLVRVDYFSDKMESTRADMVNKARVVLLEKLKNYKLLLGNKLDSMERKLADGFRVVYPMEMYKSYQAYSSTELNLKRAANVNQAEKSTTLYYQPILDKEFDFVINPSILEPVIQVMYEIKMEINREKEIKTDVKQFYIITPSGDLKKIDPKN